VLLAVFFTASTRAGEPVKGTKLQERPAALWASSVSWLLEPQKCESIGSH